jgi:hypothetical protein
MANRFALVNGKVFTAAGIRYGSWPNRRDGHRCGTEPGHRTGSGYGTGPDHAIDIEALLIEGNTIAETGTTVRILEMVGGPETPAVPVVDLQGRTVIPGLVDSHNHILSTADLIEGVNCFGLKTIDELKEAVSQAAANDRTRSVDSRGRLDRKPVCSNEGCPPAVTWTRLPHITRFACLDCSECQP